MNTARHTPAHGPIALTDENVPVAVSPERRARERFLKAFGIVALGCLAWYLLVPYSYFRAHHGRGGRQYDSAPSFHEDGTPHIGSQIHIGDDDVCAQWAEYDQSDDQWHDDYPFAMQTTFKLPVSSDRLFVVAHGVLAHGHINVTQSDVESDEVGVHVVAKYYNDEALERAEVCAMHRGDDGDGIGIFTPTHGKWDREDQLRFIINVKLPASDSSPLDIQHFETDLHLFVQSFSDLADSVNFKKMTLRGSNMPITASSVSVLEGTLKTSNSPIVGNFSTSTRLELVTSNSPIKVTVNLTSPDEDTPTELIMASSNGVIESDIRLYSTARSDETGGSFIVSAHTSNSPLSITYATAPVDSILSLDARTSNSPASLQLHPTYEGTFEARTTIFGVSLDGPDTSVEDPSGDGRKRNSQVSIVRGAVHGAVYWGEEKERAGDVVVATSNSPLALHV